MSRPTVVGIHNLSLIFLLFGIPWSCGKYMCSKPDYFKDIVSNSYLNVSTFETVPNVGLLQCVRECQIRSLCRSINYQLTSGTCSLNSRTNSTEPSSLVISEDHLYSDIVSWPKRIAGVCANHTCPMKSVCRDDGNNPKCEVAYCLHPMNQNDMPMNSIPEVFSPGEEIPLACPTGYHPRIGSLKCQGGIVSDVGYCQDPPTTCNDVQDCDPGASDGEYWLKPFSYIDRAVKVYCQFTKHRTFEFISLLDDSNKSQYPNETKCKGNGKKGNCGTTIFQKVRIWSKSDGLQIAVWNCDHVNRLDDCGTILNRLDDCDGTASFGRAGGCLACSPSRINQFRINTTGTGLIVDPNTTWTVATGFVNITWSEDKRLVVGECHSQYDECHPDTIYKDNRLNLVIDQDYQPPEESAKTVRNCN